MTNDDNSLKEYIKLVYYISILYNYYIFLRGIFLAIW